MNLTSSLKALIDTVKMLLEKYQLLESQNEALRKENAELKNQSLNKEEEIVLLRYKNELAKSRIESIINRLKAVDQSLAETSTESLPAFFTGQIEQHQAKSQSADQNIVESSRT